MHKGGVPVAKRWASRSRRQPPLVAALGRQEQAGGPTTVSGRRHPDHRRSHQRGQSRAGDELRNASACCGWSVTVKYNIFKKRRGLNGVVPSSPLAGFFLV